MRYKGTTTERLDRIERVVREMKSAQKIEINLELRQMADFTKLNSKVSRIGDLASSVKAAYDGAITERDAARAERDALMTADSTDQAAVDAAETSLAAAEAIIASLTAVAAGTPVTLPPDTGASVGGSTGGIKSTE